MTDDPAMLGQSQYARMPRDHYCTPAWVTEALMPELPLRHTAIWECAAGKGHMSEVLQRYVKVTSTDVVKYSEDDDTVVADFLKETVAREHAIVTNPPYDMAEEFLRHALLLTRPVVGVVAMLMRNEFDSAATRRDLFANPPFMKKLVLTKRPEWFAEKKASPRHNFAWFIFDWAYTGLPVLKYSFTAKQPKKGMQRMLCSRESLDRDFGPLTFR